MKIERVLLAVLFSSFCVGVSFAAAIMEAFVMSNAAATLVWCLSLFVQSGVAYINVCKMTEVKK